MNPRNYQQSRMMELHADLFSFTRDNIMTRMDPDGQAGRRALDFKNAAASGAYDPDDLKDQSSHPNKRGSQALCDDNYNVVLTAVERLVDAGDHRKNVLRFFARMTEAVATSAIEGHDSDQTRAELRRALSDTRIYGDAVDAAERNTIQGAAETLLEILLMAYDGVDMTADKYDFILSEAVKAGMTPRWPSDAGQPAEGSSEASGGDSEPVDSALGRDVSEPSGGGQGVPEPGESEPPAQAEPEQADGEPDDI